MYDQYGNANTKAFSDEALQAQKKTHTRPKLSAFEKVCTADRSYEKLCALSAELDNQLDLGEIDLESWAYARKQLDKKLERSWEAVKLLRGWSEEPEQYPSQPLDFTLNAEPPRPIAIDYSVLPSDSVFAELQDGNIFKIIYTHVLTACRWFDKFTSTAKQLVQEGVI